MQTRVTELEGDLKAAKAELNIIRRERPLALFWLAVIVGITLVTVLVVLGLTVYFAPQ